MIRRLAPMLLALAGVIGLALSGFSAAHASTDAPYTLVAWQIIAGPGHELDADQPFITDLAGATTLDALDTTLATQACGEYVQVDLYRNTDSNGTPVESLWVDGVLHPNHDGGFLAYDLMPTPYKTVEIPACGSVTPSASASPSTPATSSSTEPSDSTTPSTVPSSPPSDAPTSPALPTGSPSVGPTSPVTVPSTPAASSTPTVSAQPSSSATSTPPTHAAVVADGTTPPSSGSTTATELAYTGTSPLVLPLLLVGFAALLAGVLTQIRLSITRRREER